MNTNEIFIKGWCVYMIRALTGTEDGVRRIYVDVQEPLHTLEALDRLLRTDMIEPKDYNYAELCDNGLATFVQDDPNCYPLKFKSNDRSEELWLSALSVGGRNAGSHGTLQALILMGFQVNAERDVYHLAKGTKKVFNKKI